MSSDAPMRTRRTRRERPAGFASPTAPAPATAPTPERQTAPSPASDTALADQEPQRKPTTREAPRQPRPSRAPSSTGTRDPYADAPVHQINVRLLTPLRDRYHQLSRELNDDGFRTNFTEILTALMDDGPTTADDARELVRRYRRKREA